MPLWTHTDHIPTVTTTAKETFTGLETALMAYSVYKRFGYNTEAACEAWSRMMQSTPDYVNFDALVELGEGAYKKAMGANKR